MASSEAHNLYQVSVATRIRRWALRKVFRLIFHILCDIHIIGKENIPKDGAYIIAHNHISLFEPPFIATFWPTPPEAVSGADVFFRPGQKIMVMAYGAIPLHRGRYDRKAIDIMVSLLEQGMPLLIAPEGGRSHAIGLRRALPGVAFILDQAKVHVLPIGIVGSTDDLLKRAFRFERPRLEMHIGEPFKLPPITGKGEARRQSRQKNVDLMMQHIASLLPDSYHGVYAHPDSLSPTT
jgi:1-acyl-sn-glycerol-3-phosphate acyltransferase